KSRYLSVDGVAAEGGIEGFDLGARLRFQPRLGILPVERVRGIGAGLPRTVELPGEPRNFRRVLRACRPAFAESEEKVALAEFRELDAAHPQAGASMVL